MGMIINPYRFLSPNTPPACISDGNTVAWYIADDLTTITKDGSNLVSRWNDKLGSGNDLLQGNNNNKPVWYSDGIQFDGSGDSIGVSFTYSQPHKIYIVLKQNSWTLYDVILEGASASYGSVYQDGTSPQIELYSGSFTSKNGNLSLDQFAILRILFNGSSSSIQVNDTTKTTGNCGSRNMDGIYLGGRNGTGHIKIKEAIYRKVNDNSTDETAIYNYLASKYGFTTI